MFELSLYEEELLGYSGNAYYGFDNVTLGLGAGLPMLSHQLIAGIATPDFWLGSLGLSPLPFNFTTLNEPLPSLLGSLRNEEHIPSASWAYTAGAHYQDPPIFGSLTLGGYDSSRFVPNNLSIAFGADQSRDLVVGLQSITYDTVGSSPLLSSGIYMFIDSMVSQIWLPIDVCKTFEQVFNLTWNDKAELYLIDDAVHNKLVAQNPTFKFTVGATGKGGESVDISIPYGAFDLSISPPLVNSTSRYFPLKRAQNSTQYTLGRVFLQQAYIIADYDHSNFSISQALFPPTSVPQHLVPILRSGTASAPVSAPVSHKGLSPGAIAGIAIAAAVVIFIIILVTVMYVRRRRQQRATTRKPSDLPEWKGDPSAPASSMPELGIPEKRVPELTATKHWPRELAGSRPSDVKHELEDRTPIQKDHRMKHELEDQTPIQRDDRSPLPVYELADSHVPAPR